MLRAGLDPAFEYRPRRHGRYAIGATATLVPWTAWNLVVSENDARSLDVDAPVIPLSWQDVGSGVGAFLFTALTLGLLGPRRAARPRGRRSSDRRRRRHRLRPLRAVIRR